MHSQSEPRTLAAVKAPISREALDQLFREARTHSTWLPEPVRVELLRKAYELARLGPTSANAYAASMGFPTIPLPPHRPYVCASPTRAETDATGIGPIGYTRHPVIGRL